MSNLLTNAEIRQRHDTDTDWYAAEHSHLVVTKDPTEQHRDRDTLLNRIEAITTLRDALKGIADDCHMCDGTGDAREGLYRVNCPDCYEERTYAEQLTEALEGE